MTSTQLDAPEDSATSPGRTLARETLRQTAATFLATLAIQATAFAALAAAGRTLDREDFARLSIIVATTMLSAALFELGLNVTSVKMYYDARDEAFLRAAFAVRVLCLPLGAALGLAAYVWGSPDIGLGIGLGALLNIWNGARATDQALQDYRSFVQSSLLFAGLRSIAVLAALYFTRDPVMIAIATYALPNIAVAFSVSTRYGIGALSSLRKRARELVWYATHVYLEAVAYIAIPYAPQFFISSRLDSGAVGSYGLILTFTGPVSLLIYSLRSVLLPKILLPKILGAGSQFEDMLWSRRGLGVIAALWAALMAGGWALGWGLDQFYGQKFPEIRPAFLLFFAGFSATSMIGFYSLSVHTQGVPHISMVISVIKLMILLAILAVAGYSLNSVIIFTSIIMMAGEITLIGALGLQRWRQKT